MTLETLLENLNIPLPKEFRSLSVSGVACHSKQVKPGDLFVAVKGADADGAAYIPEALEHGAKVIVSERDFPSDPKTVKVIVPDARKVLAWVCHRFYETPSETLKVIGITGTNGKTTVAHLVESLLKEAGFGVGLIGTIAHRVGDREIPAQNTTPGALEIQSLLSQMVHAASHYAVMEVSSHALDQQRVTSVKFQTAVFTNLTHDHLDYHKTFDDYIEAKKRFFDQLPASSWALVNTDDKRAGVMLQNSKARKHSYGLKSVADFKAKILENNLTGLILDIDGNELHSRLIGKFNASNLLAVYSTGILFGLDKIECLQALSGLEAAEGRFEHITSPNEGIVGIIDYAHTPDALKNVLSTIQSIRTGQEKIISIVGCGGDRDKEKRPLMAEIACQLSDQVILTSDNPRSEDPENIIEDMESGVTAAHKKKVLSIVARKEAIKTACAMANRNDIILLAGKGHEKYQEIKGERFPFDDKEILEEFFELLDK
ncbi:MAG: UDP-N-acetylmuramoyl-L-alanyl-D-glutamate--2,6-diaminopimelate ligase [Bacteroidetes bacterium]|nr:UDP-N-acetylmuramoyl-L-alanyl-D-glutamate--2,6-diaminopimelate ligase [Bacteroidota bacterium]